MPSAAEHPRLRADAWLTRNHETPWCLSAEAPTLTRKWKVREEQVDRAFYACLDYKQIYALKVNSVGVVPKTREDLPMKRPGFATIVVVAALGTLMNAQAPTFEVASIKP